MYSTSYLKELANKLGFEWEQHKFPKEFILNFSDEKNTHGCARKCSYCNWKDHPLAQSELYPTDESIDKYLGDFHGITTLCGGGDPLYNFERNKDRVFHLIEYLQNKKNIVRIITREFDTFFKVKEKYPYILGSFSIDSFKELKYNEPFIEYSIVLNRELYRELLSTKLKCLNGFKIIAREPMGTDFKMTKGMLLMLINPKIELCTSAINKNLYLVGNQELHGYEIFI